MRLLVLIGLAALAVRAHAAFDVFLLVTPPAASPVSGGISDPLYMSWVKCLGFETGALRTSDPGKLGGNPFTAFTPFALLKTVDLGTTEFFKLLTSRAPISSVKMVIVNRIGQRTELWDIEATTCHLLGQSFEARYEDAEVVERLDFLVGRFEWSYMEIAPSGQGLRELFASWDSLANNGAGTGTSGVRPPLMIDLDADALPDAWEIFYGLNKFVNDSAADPDGDGLTNRQEYLAHTHPLSPNSTLRITAVQKPGATTYGLTWTSVAGLTYRILSAPAPGGPYTHIQTVPSAGDGVTSTTVVSPGPPLFLRVATP